MENKTKYIIIAIIAIITVVGVVGSLFLTNGGLQIGTPPFKNTLEYQFIEDKEVENPYADMENMTYTGKITYYLYISGFSDLNDYELLNLKGYTIESKALDKDGDVLDSSADNIDEYTMNSKGVISFGQLKVDDKKEVDKIIVIINDENGHTVQTIEKNI